MPLRNTIRAMGSVAALVTLSVPTAAAGPFDDVTVSNDRTLAAFESVYIAPVQVDLPTDVRTNIRDINSPRAVTENDQTLRAERLQRDLSRAFDRHFTLADGPGDGVLTVETTVTGLRSTRPTLADAELNVQIDFSSIFAGGADYEAKISENKTELVTITDSFQSSLNDGRPRIGVWQDADRASRRFSDQLARYVRNN
ncbi:MAG: DUF3313 family protein [Pseudomonadota bacterium]